MADLKIAEDLALPVEAVTQTFALLGKRGVGKTHAASVLAEEMLGAGQPVVILDPLDVWWGLRSSADGEHPGLPIVVLGGSHGDIPLAASDAQTIADLVVEEALPVVLSMRHMTKNDQRRFVTDFCERLYHRKGEDRYRQPLHIFIDEADAFIPQRVFAGYERMVGAVDDLVRRGRASGIGVTLITQRAAVVNKDVLTQIEVLVALRTISPQDRKALEAWIEAHDAYDQRKEFMASLASLPIGTAWFWSPGWLDLFKRVKVRARHTFDSSATPKIGAQPATPRKMREVDIERLRELLASTVERAQEMDPKLLMKRIAELEKQLRSRPSEVKVETVTVVERVEVPVLDEDARRKLSALCAAFEEHLLNMQATNEKFSDLLGSFIEQTGGVEGHVKRIIEQHAKSPAPQLQESPKSAIAPAPIAEIARNGHSPEVQLKKGERRMLWTLLRYFPGSLTRVQLATLSGFAPNGGTYGTYLSTLRRAGLVEEVGGQLSITVEGSNFFGPTSPVDGVMDAEELRAVWRGALKAGERKMLDVLIEAYPASLTRAELAEATDFEVTGGTFGTYLSTLRRNGLAKVDGQQIRAADVFFLGLAETVEK